MSIYNDLLISFMQTKDEKIVEILDLPPGVYFNEADRTEIGAWSEDEAKTVWNDIKKNVHVTAPTGLRREVCPFCHKYGLVKFKKPLCETCGYGARHGICGKKDAQSDYLRIINAFNDKEIVCGRFFNSDYYEELIGRLELDARKEASA
jgi:hypothetical protein